MSFKEILGLRRVHVRRQRIKLEFNNVKLTIMQVKLFNLFTDRVFFLGISVYCVHTMYFPLRNVKSLEP